MLADVNGDGKADVLVYYSAVEDGSKSLAAQIESAISNGQGGFAISATGVTGIPTPSSQIEEHETCDGQYSPIAHCVLSPDHRVLVGDVDGDGRADVVLLQPSTSGGNIQAWRMLSNGLGTFSQPASGTTPFPNLDLEKRQACVGASCGEDCDNPRAIVPCPSPDASLEAEFLVADFNGDGAADLAAISPSDVSTPVVRAVGDRAGNWGSASSDVAHLCSGNCPSVKPVPLVGDVNGDGQDDIAFAYSAGGAAAKYADLTAAAPSGNLALAGDQNGDGREDLVSVRPQASSQVQVRTFRQLADGSYKALAPATVSVPSRVPEHLPAHGWYVADVNGDGRADLVNLPAGSPTGLVLIADGDDGWDPHAFSVGSLSAASAGQLCTTSSPGQQPVLPIGRWLILRHGGSAREDLVHVGEGPFAGSCGVLVLSLGADGTLDPSWSQPSGLSPFDFLDPRHWVAADVSGNGQGDLVYANPAGGDIETLLAVAGGWRTISQVIHILPPTSVLSAQGSSNGVMTSGIGDDPEWSAIDVNGDGSQDVGRVVTVAPGEVAIETLFSEGNGHWATSTYGPVQALDAENWTPGYVDRDNRQDWVSVTNGSGEAIVQSALSNGANGSWTLQSSPVTTPPVAGLPASALWSAGDVNGDGRLELSRVDDGPGGPIVSALSSDRPLEAVTGIDNGLGTRTTVNYGAGTADVDASAVPDPSCQDGIGGAAPVVTSLITSDAATSTTDSSAFSFSCLLYSQLLRAPLAWGQTDIIHAAAVNRPSSTEDVVRQARTDGVVQTTLDQISDGTGVIQSTASTYVPPSPGADVDQLATQAVSSCQSGTCATSTDAYTYDAFGNLTSTLERAAGSNRKRKTTTTYLHDHGAYLEDLPQLTQTVNPARPNTIVRASMTCYDGDTSAQCDQLPSAPRGLPTETRTWYGAQQKYVVTDQATYDSYGNQITSTDADGHTTTTTWDPDQHIDAVETCNGLDQCTHRPEPWDRSVDAPTLVVDPNGAKTSYAYDELGRIHATVGPDGVSTTTTYATNPTTGTVEQDSIAGADGTQGPWTRTYTDGLGRVYRVEQPGGAGQPDVVTDTAYSDGSTRPYRTSAPYFQGATPASDTFSYDALGRPLSTVHADQTMIHTSYGVTRTGYTIQNGFDELGRKVTQLRDGWGALAEAEQPSDEHPSKPAITKYTYDIVGDRLTATNPHGNVLSDTYDTLGREVAERDPDRGTTKYQYDLAGNLLQTTDARGRTVTYTYDALRRRTTEHDAAENTTSGWNYDQTGHGSGAIGELTSIHDPSAAGCPRNASQRLSYDLAGRVTNQTYCVKGHTAAFATTYDSLGQLATVRYPNAEKLTYEYSPAGELQAIPHYVAGLTYNATGQITKASFANGTTGTWVYEPARGWNTNQTVSGPAGNLFDLTTGHYANGLTHTEKSASNQVNETYTYDANDQLARATGSETQTLTYDDLGDIKSNSELGAYTYPTSRTCPTCAGPHAVTTAGINHYTYDAAGDTITARKTGQKPRTFAWNSQGLLTRLTDPTAGTVTSTYDADGDLVQRTTAHSTVDFLGPLAEWSSATGYTTYVDAGGLLIAQHARSGTLWYATDARGTPRLITNAKGQVTSRVNTTPLGQAIALTGAGNEIGYAGHRDIGTTGLIDMSARDYDPQLGRMLTADTIVPQADDPLALNRYAYAGNDPIDNIDPSGHDDISSGHSVDCEGGNGCTNVVGLAQFFNTSDSYAYEGAAAIYNSSRADSFPAILAAPNNAKPTAARPAGTPTATPATTATTAGASSSGTSTPTTSGTFIPWAPPDPPQSTGDTDYLDYSPDAVVYRAIDDAFGGDTALSLAHDILGPVDDPDFTLETNPSSTSADNASSGANSDPFLQIANGVAGNTGVPGFSQYQTGPRPLTGLDKLALAIGAPTWIAAAAGPAVLAASPAVSLGGLAARYAAQASLTGAAAARILPYANLDELTEDLEGGTVILGHYTRRIAGGVWDTLSDVLLPAAEELGGRLLSDLPRDIEAMKPAIDAAQRIVFFTAPQVVGLTLQEAQYITSNAELLEKTIFVYGAMNPP